MATARAAAQAGLTVLKGKSINSAALMSAVAQRPDWGKIMLFGAVYQTSFGAAPGGVQAVAPQSGDEAPDRLIERYRLLSLHLVLATLAIATLLVLASGITVDPSRTGVAAQVLAAALLASAYCWTKPRLGRLADCCGTLGLVWLAGLGGGVISLMGLRFHRPLADQMLLQLDRTLGIDTPGLVSWLVSHAEWPAMATMSYNYTVPILSLSLFVQSLAGRRIEAWRAALCFVGSLLTICLISILTPAKGLGMWMTDDVLAQLPNGAARYFWPSFDQFYSATADPVLTLTAIDGVVSFPSFHTVMGLITVALWRHSAIGLGLAMAWFAQMMTGTIPLGGHYFVDLVGGAAIWGGWFYLSRRFERTLPNRA